MYVCLMDRDGKKLVHSNIRNNDFEFFLKLIEPYKHDLTVCCECMFGWYWLADACQASGLTFVLAHALYLKAIHGGKNKNDRIDSEKIAHLLRSNLNPSPMSIRPINGPCAPCCASASSSSGNAPICWPASSPFNWPTTARPFASPVPIAITGKKNSWLTKTIPCASWPSKMNWP
jgi:hypothetical protein